MRLQNKVAIVTGGCRGIGQAISLKLLSEGAFVYLTTRDEKTCDEITQLLHAYADHYKILEIDVTVKSEIIQAIGIVIKEFGKIDILVNNAGVAGVEKVIDVTDELWNDVFNVNVRGVFWFTKFVLPYMINQKSGRVINISSQAGIVGQPYNSVYSASKFAIIGLTQSLASEYGRFGITFNAICPGDIRTAMAENSALKYCSIQGVESDAYYASLSSRTPLGRLGEPEEVANVVAFLASSEASFITGSSILVTGGQIMS